MILNSGCNRIRAVPAPESIRGNGKAHGGLWLAVQQSPGCCGWCGKGRC